MPFVKGNTIGKETRFKTGQSVNPAARPPDRLRKRIEAELEKIASSEPGEARTKLELLAENIVSNALRGDSQSRKLLIERLYPMLNRHEIARAEGEAINIRWEAEMQQASEALREIIGGGEKAHRKRAAPNEAPRPKALARIAPVRSVLVMFALDRLAPSRFAAVENRQNKLRFPHHRD